MSADIESSLFIPNNNQRFSIPQGFNRIIDVFFKRCHLIFEALDVMREYCCFDKMESFKVL